jgi:hypothetical protein
MAMDHGHGVETHGESIEVPCCPVLVTDQSCDTLDFHYRLKHPTTVVVGGRRVLVEVLIHARLERCSGDLALGDLVYSTTLLPGEKVRLATTDRRTRFTLDTSSNVSYRNEQTSEERFYMSSMANFMSDVTVRDSGSASASSHSSVRGHAETSGALETLFGSPSVDVSGSHDSSSTSNFLRELHQHANSSEQRSTTATRAASSVSVGEVSTRTHAQGSTEDHFESSSRTFENRNRCHAVTYFFYQINKLQTVRFKIVAIQRRVIDPAADTRVTNNDFRSDGDMSAIPQAILATDTNRIKLEEAARVSVLARQASSAGKGDALAGGASVNLRALQQDATAIPQAAKQRALTQVDQALVKQGLLGKNGRVTDELVTELSFERTTSLPTAGMLVKGCLDECNTCEPAFEQEIALEIEHKRLQNDLLKRQIELLDKSQEYRCCPVGESESEPA